MIRKVEFIAGLVFGVLLAAATTASPRVVAANKPSAGAAAAPAANAVSIRNFSFQPAVLVVKVGARVTWTNADNTPHTVTSADKHFVSSAGLDTGDQYSIRFDQPGSYVYFCSLHPMMVGRVIVQPAR